MVSFWALGSISASNTLFSGTAPLVATTLIRETGTPVAPALLLVAYGLLTLAASFGLPKYGGHVLGTGAPELGARG